MLRRGPEGEEEVDNQSYDESDARRQSLVQGSASLSFASMMWTEGAGLGRKKHEIATIRRQQLS